MVLKRHRAGLERTRSIYLIRRSKGSNAPPLDGVWRHLASRGQPPAVSLACFDGACLLHQVCAALPNPAAGHGSQLRAPGSRPGLLPHPGSNCRPWLTRGLAALGPFLWPAALFPPPVPPSREKEGCSQAGARVAVVRSARPEAWMANLRGPGTPCCDRAVLYLKRATVRDYSRRAPLRRSVLGKPGGNNQMPGGLAGWG